MTRHELKTWPQYFAAVRSGKKRFEIRRNDREFAVGDVLVLREFDPEQDAYTGQVEERQITFLLSEEDYGVIHGFVAIGFGEVVHHGDMRRVSGLKAAPTGFCIQPLATRIHRADRLVPRATRKVTSRWVTGRSLSQPKNIRPTKVASRKKAISPSMASGAPKMSPT